MRKFVNSKFELDISNLGVAIQEENHWFSDKFFTKFSLPFDISLDESMNENLGFIRYFNSSQTLTVFEGYYYEFDQIHQAILEVEEITDKVSLSMRYGFEEFPSFEKKIRELPLEKFEVEDIYLHAKEVINQSWPTVNYNFPQIHVDKIDTEEENWFYFEKIINNYKDGNFLENYQDLDTEIIYNKNIIQPLPYLLYVFKTGFESAGYTLDGDILENDTFKRMLLYADVEYYSTVDQESYTIFQMSEDKIEQGMAIAQGTFPGIASWSSPIVNPNYMFFKYFKKVDINHPGRYRIIGKIKMQHFPYDQKVRLTIKYREQIIVDFEHNFSNMITSPTLVSYNINHIFETLSDINPHFITIESYQGVTTDKIIFDLEINPIRLHDSNGEAIATVINANQVDLVKAVPEDLTFGELFTAFRNWFNIGIDNVERKIIVNFIEKELSRKSIIDLQFSEIKIPTRKPNKGMSFLLKFQDFDTKEYKYKYQEIFQNSEGTVNELYKKDEKTQEIIINALPLPMLSRSGIQTAHAFLNDQSRIFVVLYNGLQNGLNLCFPPDEILLPIVHQKYYKSWFEKRINAQAYSWTFIAPYEKIQEIKAKGKIFAYHQNHLIKNIIKEEISKNQFRIDIETETLH